MFALSVINWKERYTVVDCRLDSLYVGQGEGRITNPYEDIKKITFD